MKQKAEFDTNSKNVDYTRKKGPSPITKLISYNWNAEFIVHGIFIHDRSDVRSKTIVGIKHYRKGNTVN